LNLNRPGIFRAGLEKDKLRRRRVRNIENTPTSVPEMRKIKIPAAVDFLHGQFEGGPAVEIMITENFCIVGEISLGDRLSHS
jgi:hypothetical protein